MAPRVPTKLRLPQVTLLLAVSVGAVATAAPAVPALPEYYLTANCAPCTLAVSEVLPTIAVTYTIATQADGSKAVTQLQLRSDNKPGWSQVLPVHDMLPVQASDDFLLGVTDLNFDNCNELYFVTSRGVANAYADYWRFDPHQQKFVYLGNFPLLTVDQSKHTISAYERGGHGGMIYTATKYVLQQNKLVPIEIEKQDAATEDGVYIKSRYALKDGKLQLIKTEKVQAPP